MATSYNGWPASRDLPIRPLVVAGESFVPGVLDDDDVYTVLRYVAEQMHERVEPIYAPGWHQEDDWGFYYRPTTGSTTTLSNHSSGTAIDYNATRHPYGRWNTFTSSQQATIRSIIADLPIVWGGDYRYTPDDMHFEIMGSRTAVATAAARIRNMGKDWFDMADKEDLRQVVREEIDRKFEEKIEVKNGDRTRRISYTQLFRELWQKINKHT